MRIAIEQLTKRFGGTLVLDRVDLEIREREFLGLLGPSGSGKTTLLRILAGLEFADTGRVLFDGAEAQALPIAERQVGMVFQHYALFGHMTVFNNVAFGLKVRPRPSRPPRNEIAKRVERLLHLVQLDGLGDRFPGQLSGGQRQRVALARALATEPKVLLLDEPFGALDAKVRVELRRWLRDLHDSTGLTTIFVTHDQEEALALADRVAIMAAGRIEQVGSPTEVYEGPQSPFVYDFLGRTNAFDCVVENGRARLGDKAFAVDGAAGRAGHRLRAAARCRAPRSGEHGAQRRRDAPGCSRGAPRDRARPQGLGRAFLQRPGDRCGDRPRTAGRASPQSRQPLHRAAQVAVLLRKAVGSGRTAPLYGSKALNSLVSVLGLEPRTS